MNAKQYGATFAAQQKQIAELMKQVALGNIAQIPTTPEKMMTDTQAVVPVTVSKLPLQLDDGDENSDTTPKPCNDWQEDEEDQKKGWESPVVTSNQEDDLGAVEDTLGNQGDGLDSLYDTEESDDDAAGDVKYIGSIAAPPAAKRHIPESSSEEESSEEEEEVKVDNSIQLKPHAIQSPTRFRKGKHDKSNLPVTSHRRETRSSRRRPNNITNSRGPGVGEGP